ncbi:MAG TPA: dihydrolipoamide acetyltransferase family protein [Burkholderiaceae bacterium]|nr:dihydrolipoamide acetyltransferase family protein [Burkholderiaceae bacterium]
MAERTIKMPDIGEGIAEVELVAWHVKPGDTVAEDQALADVMTDKASVEIPSPVSGTVTWIGGAEGTVFAVGAELVKIETSGEAKAPARASAAPARPAPPTAAKPASPAPAPSAPPGPAPAPVATGGDRPIATPSVRRRAWELGIDLAQVKPSGTAGRVMQADLDAYAKAHPTGVRSMPMQTASAPATPSGTPRSGEEAIPVIGLRRKIALKMQEAKRRIPHFSYVEECDVTELEALRHALNTRHGDARGKLTLLPFLMRAITVAVVEHPSVNATFDDEKGVLTRHAPVHLGIATQTDAGLMVPVVRHTEALDLWQSASEVSRLAAAARDGRITRGELSGSTITITSLGPIGGIVTTPIINAPEVAIVGVNRIAERPAVRGGAIVPRLLMNLSSSFDHRVVDGHGAALFVQSLKRLLETPALLFVE